jgi:hypothetical protein
MTHEEMVNDAIAHENEAMKIMHAGDDTTFHSETCNIKAEYVSSR